MTAIQPRHQPRRARLVGAAIAGALICLGVTGLDATRCVLGAGQPARTSSTVVTDGHWQVLRDGHRLGRRRLRVAASA